MNIRHQMPRRCSISYGNQPCFFHGFFQNSLLRATRDDVPVIAVIEDRYGNVILRSATEVKFEDVEPQGEK